MTILALILGALLAGAGTRLAAAGFVAAAALGALDGGGLRGPFVGVVTWSAALAAGCVLLERASVRRLGLAALGMTAVLAAGLADNGAVVGGLWVAGSVAAVLAAVGADLRDLASQPQRLRWAVSLCLIDVLVLGAIVSAAPDGFEGWPFTLPTYGAAMLLASGALRLLLADGPDGTSTAGLLVIRTQALVLVTIATVAGGPGIARTTLIAGSVIFAAAPFLRRLQTADVTAEVSMYAIAIAATALGLVPAGWSWGALAAGTLIHHLRLMVGRRTAGRWADATLRSAGIGLPFLPVVVAVVGGAMAARGWALLVVGLGSMVGLAGRSQRPTPAAPRRTRATTRANLLEDVRGIVVVAAAFVAAIWAGAMTLPRAVAAIPVGWPPAWVLVAVVVCGTAGSIVGGVVPGRRRAPVVVPDVPRPVAATVAEIDARAARLGQIVPGGRPVLLAVALGILAAVAAGMWIFGLTRGFL